jgi:potassium-transporting ATPase ATP-binding subunit
MRGALTTFSIASGVAKCFMLVPMVFVATHPALGVLNIVRLASPESAILSTVMYNALIIVPLIALALRGVNIPVAIGPHSLFRNVLIYGLGGILVPLIGIKLIDVLLSACGWL